MTCLLENNLKIRVQIEHFHIKNKEFDLIIRIVKIGPRFEAAQRSKESGCYSVLEGSLRRGMKMLNP